MRIEWLKPKKKERKAVSHAVLENVWPGIIIITIMSYDLNMRISYMYRAAGHLIILSL